MAEPFVDAADAREFLRGHLGCEPTGFEFVGEGAWSRCFGFSDRGNQRVARFGHHLDDFENDRRASSFRSAALPVPELFEIGPAFDGYFAISSRVYGEPLESLSAAAFTAVLPSLLAALDAMQAIDLSANAGWGGWCADGSASHSSWRDFLLAVEVDTADLRTAGWRRRLSESPIGGRTFRVGLEKLAALTEVGLEERGLVHGDLLNRNVLVERERIGGVFDWGCSTYGDPLYDIAWIEFWKPWFEGLAPIDFLAAIRRHQAASGVEIADFESRLLACLIHIGLSHLAYHAHTGKLDDLLATEQRLLPLLD